MPTGQLKQPYSVLFTCQAPLGTGTCGGTGDPNNAAGQYQWSATSNNIAGTSFATPLLVLNPTGGAPLFGTPTTANSNETVTISVSDNGNLTTPSCTVAATCPSQYFTANIVPSQAYVGANGNNAIARFDTSSGAGGVALVGSAITVGGAGTTPHYVAASPSGTYMYIADPGNHQVIIRNTLTGSMTTVTSTQGLHTAAGDVQAIAVIARVVPTTGISPDDVNLIVANYGTDTLDVIDADPTTGSFGTVTGSATFSLGGSYPGNGPIDLKMAPTFFVSGVRQTHGYVVRAGGDEVCVFDVEPSSASFGNEIAAAHSPNADKCIPLLSASGVNPWFIDISPDGLHAFITETNGTTQAALKIIDTNPNNATFETLIGTIDLAPAPVTIGTGDGTLVTFTGNFTPVPVVPGSLQVVAGAVTGTDDGSGAITGTGITGTVNYATGAISVTFDVAPTTGTLVQVSNTFATANLAGVRVSPDGQMVWVAGEDTGKLLGFETALVGSTQFRMVSGISTPIPGSDNPIGIAFRPDGAFGLATLSAGTPNSILPFTTTAGTAVATTGVTTPFGIDHISNGVLHIVTTTLPAATHGVAYASSVVANGPNKYFTFTDLTAGPNNLAGLGFTLSPDGQVTSASASSSTGTYTFTIQAADQSQPVNNVVQKTISLTIN
jgi:DNA-binding beta-propeller fold protein YncE